MDEKKLQYEFMSISGESHPGLTFEEYRDSCVFLLFYQYLCLKYDDVLEDAYKPSEMVRIAVRGKLQMPAFLHFMETASSFLHVIDGRFQLTEFSFYQKLLQVHSLEKQKSYARFFRKLIKKIDAWNTEELLFEKYPELFTDLMEKFSQMKKETFLSGSICRIFRLFFANSGSGAEKIFLPDFSYGLLARDVLPGKTPEGKAGVGATSAGKTAAAAAKKTAKKAEKVQPQIYGYEKEQNYVEIFTAVCCMNGISPEQLHLFSKKNQENETNTERFDRIAVYKPEGVEAGELLCPPESFFLKKEWNNPGTKGELPFLLSALSRLAENGSLAVLFPGAFLYREGKEAQMRRYLVDELNCLDTVLMLPDHLFHSTGQAEVFLFLKQNRRQTDVMFFDCSETEEFGEEQIRDIETAWLSRENISGFSACVKKEVLAENDYNLNLPRYIAKPVRETSIDIEETRKRIAEIDRELQDVESKIAMYRRDLDL